MPHHLRAFKRELSERFGGDLARLNTAMETDFVSWNAFSRRREEFQQRSSKVLNTAWAREFDRFKQGLPRPVRYYYSIEGFFRNQYLMSQYTRDIGAYNESHGSRYESWDRVHLDRRLPAGPGRSEPERQDWLEFTRTVVSLLGAGGPFGRPGVPRLPAGEVRQPGGPQPELRKRLPRCRGDPLSRGLPAARTGGLRLGGVSARLGGAGRFPA